MNERIMSCCLAAVFLLGALPVAVAGDWPQFRGPDRDGRSAETGLADRWPAGGPEVLWRVPLGEGFSGVSVVGDRLYTLFAKDGNEYVGCFAADSGKELWRSRLGGMWKDRFGNGPRSTPTVHGKLVFGLSAQGDLAALSTKDGSVVWQRDLKADFGARIPQWGVSTSPLVHGDLLFLDVGGSKGNAQIALDKATGEVAWHSGDGTAGYAAPLPVTVGGVEQILFFPAAGLVARAPQDGAELWRHPWKTSYDINAATPVFIAPDKVFISSGYDVGAAMLRIKVDGKTPSVELVWSSREMKNQFSSSVYHQGHLYGFDDKTLRCMDAATGKTKWKKRELGHGSLILADDTLIVLGDAGTLLLVEATPTEYIERGRVQPFEGKTWTMPSLSAGRLFLRDENEMLAMKLTGGRESADPKETNTSKGE